MSAYASIRQHMSAYGSCTAVECVCVQHTPAYVSICQHMPAYVSICQHMGAAPLSSVCAFSIHQHTSAYVSIRQHTSAYVSIRELHRCRVCARVRALLLRCTSAYVSIRQHTSAYVSMHVRSKHAHSCRVCARACFTSELQEPDYYTRVRHR
jgi:hypothetical protein